MGNDTAKYIDTIRNQEIIIGQLNSEQRIIYEELRRWRMNMAKQESWAPYVIAHNKHLILMI